MFFDRKKKLNRKLNSGEKLTDEEHHFLRLDQDREHKKHILNVINQEAPWMWAVKSSWNMYDSLYDTFSFQRASVDFLLESKVNKDRCVWVRVQRIVCFYGSEFKELGEYVLQVPEESIGKNLAEAISLTLLSLRKEYESTKWYVTTVLALAIVSQKTFSTEFRENVYEGDLVTIIKPPIDGSFESLLQEVKRYKLAASG